MILPIFTDSALLAGSVYYPRCPSDCLSVRAIAENPLPGGLETSGRRAYRKYWYTSTNFFLFLFYDFLRFEFFSVFGLCLLCLMGELEGRGSVAVAVGHSDRWQVAGDIWHMTCDTINVTCDMWNMTHDAWHMTLDMWNVTCDTWNLVFYQKVPKSAQKIQKDTKVPKSDQEALKVPNSHKKSQKVPKNCKKC